MKKAEGRNKAVGKALRAAKRKDDGFAPLIVEVRELIQSARHAVASTVNTLQVLTNFEIGRRIVEHEQRGEARAAYGAELIVALSTKLTEEFGRGFSKRNLELMRRFYVQWEGRWIPISQTVSAQSAPLPIAQTLSAQSFSTEKRQASTAKTTRRPASSTGRAQLGEQEVTEPLSERAKATFALSWSHYVLLMTIGDPDERSFYEIEAASENWSLSTLKRQVASSLYERIALSRRKSEVRKLAMEG